MLMDKRRLSSRTDGLRRRKQHWHDAFVRQRHRFSQAWHCLSKGQKCMAIAAFLQLLWIVALQVQVYELSETVYVQRVRIAQLEKQAKKQNNMLYSASQTLDDIEKKWHRLNFRVLENTWRIEEPEKDPDSL
ncbi:MAG: hypothetical protein ACI4N8_05060 [Megasphaera sp.]|uniref:hypothetical protein n=1 Tax=Megasphaera sp. TaxID=2023260 RepID=UPI003F02818C